MQCTNLFERLCDCLYRNAMPPEKKPLTSIHTLAFQGLITVRFLNPSEWQILHSIAQRCRINQEAESSDSVRVEQSVFSFRSM